MNVKEAVGWHGLKVLVYGAPGVGKTRLVGTTGCPEQTLVLSAEAGLRSVVDSGVQVWCHPDREIPGIQKIDDLALAHRQLKDGGDWRWICLDSISEIAEVCLTEEKQAHKDPRAAYGEMAERIFRLLRAFRDLPEVNVYMSAKQTQIEDDGRLVYGPSFPGRQLESGVGYLFDEVFALRAEREPEGGIRQFLQTENDARYMAKDRSGKLDTFEPPNLARILAKMTTNDKE